MFKTEYLPTAKQDMVDIVRYISVTLGNRFAAEALAKGFVSAAESISRFPYANPVYIPIRPLQHEYRRLLVKNYLIFYWVDEENKLVTIARVIYAKRNYEHLLTDANF